MSEQADPDVDDPYGDLEEPRRRNLRKELRSINELVRLASSGKRLLRDGPRGNHELVVVYPGFGVGDSATAVLRAYLTNRGYSTRGWRLGRNHGDVEKLLPQIIERLEYEIKHYGAPSPEESPSEESRSKESRSKESINTSAAKPVKARLVGWSLGGYLAREVARDRPDLVEQVITFGTPVVGGPKYTASAATYRDRGDDVEAIAARVDERNLRPITVPITAIFSKSDGVVNWRACIDHFNEDVEHVEIDAPHSGMSINPDIFDLVARRLASSDPADSSSATVSIQNTDQPQVTEEHDTEEHNTEEEEEE